MTALGFPNTGSASGYRFRLILASVAPVPLVVKEVEVSLGKTPITPDSIQTAARIAAEACRPIDDVRGSARYRQQMVENLTARALGEVWVKLKRQTTL